jgi:MSHA biogenesis protein MshQ
VGNGDLALNQASYLGSGIDVSGTTGSGAVGNVGPFIPSHFTVEATQACTSVSPFTYSAQPFNMTVRARNLAGDVTRNYDGTGGMSPSFARTTGLSAVTNGGLGSLAITSLTPAAFAAGEAAFGTQSFTYTNKLTAPAAVVLRAIDTDGVTSENKTEQGPNVRSGRLQVSNAFGSGRNTLQVPVSTQYWSGRAWVINDADSGCTVLPAASVVRATYLDSKGSPTNAWTTSVSGAVTLSNGRSSIVLTAPTNGGTGSVDLSVNLGTTTSDQSCLSAHPASVGAQQPWLRSLNGSCAATYDRDPTARATFGVFSPETQRIIHTRDLF